MTNKLLTLLLVICTLGVFSSCEGPMGPPGLNGLDGNGSLILVPFFTIEEDHWAFDPDKMAYYYDIPVKELTSHIIKNGDILVSVTYDGETFYHLTDVFYPNTGISESMTYNYKPGYVTIERGALDDNPEKATCTFKITLIY